MIVLELTEADAGNLRTACFTSMMRGGMNPAPGSNDESWARGLDELAEKIRVARDGAARPAEKSRHVPRFGYDDVWAALCVWECLNDWTLNDATKRDDWAALREGVGSNELRHASIGLAQWCEAVFSHATATDPDAFNAYAFDFEVIPAILEHARDAEGPVIEPSALPDAKATAAKVVREFKRAEYLRCATELAGNQWGYPNMIPDYPEFFDSAFEAGEPYADAVARFGAKYDLTPAN